MHTIRTAEELARLLASSLDPELKDILTGHQERLSAYPDFTFEELAMIVISEPGDRLAELVGGGGSTLPELIVDHRRWLEVTYILSDDGFGIILLVDQTEIANAELVAVINTLADDLT